MHLSHSWGLNVRLFSLSGGKPACAGGGVRSRSQTSSPGTAPMKYCSSAAFVILSILRNILFQSLYDKTPRTEKPVPGSFLREFFYRETRKACKIERGKIYIPVLQYILYPKQPAGLWRLSKWKTANINFNYSKAHAYR